MSDSLGNRGGGRHPVEVGHLVMGVALLGLAGVWALVAGDVVQGDEVRWLLPLPWLAGGLVGVVATVLRGPR
ncbi:hypothetical protein [Nocardioides nanhaiensis]|uniref:DUF2530 domain-containing protein n=1 Tax=Nocardioides nanhaiensis TaxID=1476871 RepID=A0ABP8VYR2_9ACTN